MSAMVFVELKNKTDGSSYTKEELDHLTGQFVDLMYKIHVLIAENSHCV